MTQIATNIGLTTTLSTDYETALARVTNALKAEGFGIITEIDMKETFKKKLDVDFRPYKILGACNPKFAHQAVTLAPEVGLLLPCNVTVSQVDDQHVEVSAIDPLVMMSVIPNAALTEIAQEIHARLARVITALKA